MENHRNTLTILALDGEKSVNIWDILDIIPKCGNEPEFKERAQFYNEKEFTCCTIKTKNGDIHTLSDSNTIIKEIREINPAWTFGKKDCEN